MRFPFPVGSPICTTLYTLSREEELSRIGIRISFGGRGSMELKKRWNPSFSAIVKRAMERQPPDEGHRLEKEVRSFFLLWIAVNPVGQSPIFSRGWKIVESTVTIYSHAIARVMVNLKWNYTRVHRGRKRATLLVTGRRISRLEPRGNLSKLVISAKARNR